LIKRSITGFILAVVLLTLIIVQGWPLRVAMAVFMALSIWEVYGAFKHKGVNPARWVGMTYAALALPVYWFLGVAALWPLMAILCMLGFAVMVFRGEVDFTASIATVFPILYPGMMFTMLFPIQDIAVPAEAILAFLLTFGIALSCDTAAYTIGVKFGKRQLSPHISSKKTVEGGVAGLIAAVLFAILAAYLVEVCTTHIPALQPFHVALPPLWHFAILGLFGGVAAQVGDLTASMVKRYCGIKDFGSILPGHGGMMDRIDGVLFNAVVVFVYFMVVTR